PGSAAMSWTLVAHVHTKHSPDSLTEPRALAARAVALGVNVLAVTDHNTWRGAESESGRSEEHTSEFQSRRDVVCRLLLEKKKHIVCNHLRRKRRGSHVPGFVAGVLASLRIFFWSSQCQLWS